MCGEKTVILTMKDEELGSPPRVRGKVPSYVVLVIYYGITPACAGKRIFVEILKVVN